MSSGWNSSIYDVASFVFAFYLHKLYFFLLSIGTDWFHITVTIFQSLTTLTAVDTKT